MTIFDEIKESVSITDAAQRYGLTLDRYGKALCPFHSDHKPSLSFKGNRFKCFACGESGDVIDLTRQLTGAGTPLEAARRLAADFGIQVNEVRPPKPRPNTPAGIPVYEYRILQKAIRRTKIAELQ